MKCLIIGTGDMAHALARQYSQTAKDDMMNELKVASPTREFVEGSIFQGLAPFVALENGMSEADLIILAIPGSAMASFVEQYGDQMKDKLIVDINNDKESYETETFTKYDLNWTKGLNDCGAVDLLSRKSKAKPKTRLSGSDAHTIAQVKKFAEEALGFDVQVVEHAERANSEQNSIGKEWKHAAYIAILLYVIFMIITVIHYYKKFPFPFPGFSYPVTIQNKLMSSTAVGCFALAVMPGTITRIVKAKANNSLYVLHPGLVWALNIRKHLGLIGMFFLFNHAIMSIINFKPEVYYWAMYPSFDATAMDVTGEVSMMFAIYSFAFYIIIAISSLPSVSEAMNKAQWDFVFGPVCWFALACAHVHYSVIYFMKLQNSSKLYGGIPHTTILASILPWVAFLLKFIQVVFCRGLQLYRMAFKSSRSAELNTTMHSGPGSKRFSMHDSTGALEPTSRSDEPSE